LSSFVQVLVLVYADQRFLVSCDKVIGPREIVVKPLPALLAGHPLFQGATISGAGKVQLVLDVATLAAQARGSLAPVTAPPAPRRRRILLADDSRTARESVGRILKPRGGSDYDLVGRIHTAGGYMVEVAADGAEAWELLGERAFDLLVTDLEMPRMTGLELCRRLKGDSRLRELPVIVISSRSGQSHKEGVSEAGAFDMLRKPILRRALLDCVGRALDPQPTRPTLAPLRPTTL
jgi:chemosensory pili system protein ChpA (sensor histidine kinase/response regulator)